MLLGSIWNITFIPKKLPNPNSCLVHLDPNYADSTMIYIVFSSAQLLYGYNSYIYVIPQFYFSLKKYNRMLVLDFPSLCMPSFQTALFITDLCGTWHWSIVWYDTCSISWLGCQYHFHIISGEHSIHKSGIIHQGGGLGSISGCRIRRFKSGISGI